MHPVATYLSELRATRASGQAIKELSYYAPLRALLSAAGKQLDPSGERFEVTAGWGYIGHHGATMPGGGEKAERSFTPDEEAALPDGAQERFGGTSYDVYLNEVSY